MLEYSETQNIADELNRFVVGKTVARTNPPTKLHKFCWFNGDPADYDIMMFGAEVVSAQGFGIYAEMVLSNGMRLSINDGINLRYFAKGEKLPGDYQLMIAFTDGSSLVFTVSMYGGILLHNGSYDNEYYIKNKNAVPVLSDGFREYYRQRLADCRKSYSAKAFLATEQRFCGIGNGTVQDILFDARINPKRKISSLTAEDTERLYNSIVKVVGEMTAKGGRDTEKDIFGKCGGYETIMSKNKLPFGCPVCGGAIIKETYLGGSVYYCPNCQPID